jgi:hypothetical protein
MLWDDLRKIIQDNKTPAADIRYFRDPKINPRTIAVFDRSLPRRKPSTHVLTGYTEEDHWRDSHVCDAPFFGGEIPMEGDKKGTESTGGMYRGALSVLERLIVEGSLRRTDDLRHLFARHGRRLPAP